MATPGPKGAGVSAGGLGSRGRDWSHRRGDGGSVAERGVRRRNRAEVRGWGRAQGHKEDALEAWGWRFDEFVCDRGFGAAFGAGGTLVGAGGAWRGELGS